MSDLPWFALGWTPGALTGWGQFGAHFARTLSVAGYRVHLPGGLDIAGVLPMDRPLLQGLVSPVPTDGSAGWVCMAIGNALEARPDVPAPIQVAGIIFCEDVGVFDTDGVARLNAYDVIVAGSRWTERVLREKGVERVVLAHQGYDGRVFFPHVTVSEPRVNYASRTVSVGKHGIVSGAGDLLPVDTLSFDITSYPRRPLIFSGGKLEFRKGQDIAVEAFRRFRLTPEGRDAQLVVAWDNQWPQTMEGIWLSGYVKGVPNVRNGRCEIGQWLVNNGLPADSVIDCGRLTPPELAHVLRSCTVGIFPNRAESGTNLVLVEALASGLQCIIGEWTGQADVCEGLHSDGGFIAGDTFDSIPVPAGCRLYKSTEGWQEQPAHIWANALNHGRATAPAGFADYWDWSVRGPAMAQAILESAPVPA